MLDIHGTGDATMHYEGGERQGETYPAVRTWLEPWAGAAGCTGSKDSKVGGKGEKVERAQGQNCQDGADVGLYSVANGGHVWPGEAVYSGGGYVTQDFSATETIWAFFESHPRAHSADETTDKSTPKAAHE